MSTVTGKVNTSYSSHITYIRCNFTVNKFPYFSLHSQVKTMKLCVLCALIISVPTTLLQIAKTMKILCHVQAFSQCIRLEMHISTSGCTTAVCSHLHAHSWQYIIWDTVACVNLICTQQTSQGVVIQISILRSLEYKSSAHYGVSSHSFCITHVPTQGNVVRANLCRSVYDCWYNKRFRKVMGILAW